MGTTYKRVDLLTTQIFGIENLGLVVPTLGTRIDYLNETLKSLRNSGCLNIIIVCPDVESIKRTIDSTFYDQIVSDPGKGLPAAINFGINNFDESIKFTGWLCDDDLIEKNALTKCLNFLNQNRTVVAVYGNCTYIDASGNEIAKIYPKQFSSNFASFLPNLIPQPGSIIEVSALKKIGMLNENFPLAFDFEMFIKLKTVGEVRYINSFLSKFRRHENSISVSQRRFAVTEASQIRRKSLNKSVRPLSFLWEWLIIGVTLYAPVFLNFRLWIKDFINSR